MLTKEMVELIVVMLLMFTDLASRKVIFLAEVR